VNSTVPAGAFTAINGYAPGGNAVGGFSDTGVGVSAGSDSYNGLEAYSNSGTALTATTDTGLYHAKFGDTGIDQSFVARVKGAFGWIRGSFTGRIHPPDTLTADRTYTLPNNSGTVALTSDITGTNSGTNTGDETGARIASLITAATSKTTPVDADEIPITDSAASFGLKKLTFTNLKAFLKTYLDTLYVALTGAQTIAGNKTFSGQTELTGQAATNDTSAMTRALADTRYGQQLFVSQSTAETSAANTTTYVSSTQCTLALAVGTYRVEAWIQVEGLGSTGSAKGQLNFTGTATGSSIIFLAGGSPTVYLQNAVPVLAQNGGRVFNSSVAFNYSSNRGGVMHLRFNLTVTAAGTLAIQYAPAVAVALQTAEISVGSFISARKIA
jgi:hypothetical protein